MSKLTREFYMKLSYFVAITIIVFLMAHDAKSSDSSSEVLSDSVSIEEPMEIESGEPDTVLIEEPIGTEREPTSVDSWEEDEMVSAEE